MQKHKNDELDQEVKRQQQIQEEHLQEDDFEGQSEGDVRKNSVLSASSLKKRRFEGEWVDVTAAEVIQLQAENRLFGYDPKVMKAIVRPAAKNNQSPLEVQKQDDEKNRASLQEQGALPVKLVPETQVKTKAKGEK